MKTIIIFCCFTLCTSAYAQNYFDKYDHTSQYTRTQGCEIIGNQVFYSKSHHTDFIIVLDFEHWLIKADDQLNRLDSVELRSLLNIPAERSLILTEFIEDKGALELTFQSIDTAIYCGFFQSHILRFDINLNLLDSARFGLATHSFRIANTFDLNNKRLVVGSSNQCTNGNWTNTKQSVVDVSLPNRYQSFEHMASGNTVTVFNKLNDTTFLYFSGVYNLSTYWTIVNENWDVEDNGSLLGISGTNPFPGQFRQSLPFKLIEKPNALPLVLGASYSMLNNKPYFNTFIVNIDTVSNISSIDTLPIGGATPGLIDNTFFNLYASADMMDQRNLDSVFFILGVGGMAQDTFADKVIRPVYFYSYDANAMSLNKVQRVMPQYPWDHNFAVSSFSDGRLLLGFNEYNWDMFGNNTMAIHWKVISKDAALGLKNIASPNVSIEVFPNPTADFISIKSVPLNWKDIKYTLSDLKGKVVANGRLSPLELAIDLNTLNMDSGMYLFNIENGKGERSEPIKIVYQY